MEKWPAHLKKATPQKGFELAIFLAQQGVQYTQPDKISGKNYDQSTQKMLTAL